MQKKIKTIGIIVKKNVAEAGLLASQCESYLKKRKINVLLEEKNNNKNLFQKSDLILVFGGDGTFLSVARQMKSRSVPLLGINMGQLGFLTEIKKTEVFEAINAALKGKLQASTRNMLTCTLTRKGKVLEKALVVNDVVVSNGAIARIIDMKISINKKLVANVKADGLIVATPTGSTAYGLAAGGPILYPELNAMEIIPICPHSLTLRPLVISDEAAIEIVPQCKNGSVILTLDGQICFDLKPGDEIKITKFKNHSLQILNSKDRDYYSILREKLKFGFRD